MLMGNTQFQLLTKFYYGQEYNLEVISDTLPNNGYCELNQINGTFGNQNEDVNIYCSYRNKFFKIFI
jgi:hypothetical protein